MHKCTWKGCGAPATKKVHLRSRNPYYTVLEEDGTRHREKSEGKDVWLCEKHYASPEPWAHWSYGDGLIIEP